MLGHALVAANDPRLLDEAIRELSNVTQREPEESEPFQHLATAYGRNALATLCACLTPAE
jgi:predicted Zn-dependent protease